MNPRISVVIPSYNGAAYLSEAIESCLQQTMIDFEIVIVDDASPDDCTNRRAICPLRRPDPADPPRKERRGLGRVQ